MHPVHFVNGRRVVDNLDHGLDSEVNYKLAVMRSYANRGALVDKAAPGLGSFFSIDPVGDVAGDFATGDGEMLRLSYTARRRPGWVALHIPIGGVDLGSTTLVGLVCKTQADKAVTFRAALRSATGQGFVDAFLPKTVAAFSKRSTHVDLLKIEGREDVPRQAAWRDLVLFFPVDGAALSIRDARVFIV